MPGVDTLQFMGSRPRHREQTEAHGSAHGQGARMTRRCPAAPPIPSQSRKVALPPLPPVWPPSPGSGSGVGRALNLARLGQHRPGHGSLSPLTSFRSTSLPRTPSRQVPGLLAVTLFLLGSSDAQPATVNINKGTGVARGGRGRCWKLDQHRPRPLAAPL